MTSASDALEKKQAVDAAVAALTAQAEYLHSLAEQTRAGAIHEESRAENDKDTRGLEASYLARGQAARVEELAEAIQRLRFLDLAPLAKDMSIRVPALVRVDCDGAEQTYLLVPAAGGLKVEVAGETVQLLTPTAPLGRALLDKRAGDDFELRLGGRLREYAILAVS